MQKTEKTIYNICIRICGQGSRLNHTTSNSCVYKGPVWLVATTSCLRQRGAWNVASSQFQIKSIPYKWVPGTNYLWQISTKASFTTFDIFKCSNVLHSKQHKEILWNIHMFTRFSALRNCTIVYYKMRHTQWK